MKKILIGCLSSLLLLTSIPAQAQQWDYRRGVDHGGRHHPGSYREIQNHRYHDHGHRHDAARWILPIIIGGVVADTIYRNRAEPIIIETPVQCYDVRKQDYYGNVYYDRVCR